MPTKIYFKAILILSLLLFLGCNSSGSDDNRSEQFTVNVSLTNYNNSFDAGDTLGGTDGFGFIDAYEDSDDVLNNDFGGDFVKLIFPPDAVGPVNYSSLSDPFSDTFDPRQGDAAIVFLTPTIIQLNGYPMTMTATSGSINLEDGGAKDSWMTGSYNATIRGIHYYETEEKEFKEEVIEGTISGEFSIRVTASSSTIQLKVPGE